MYDITEHVLVRQDLLQQLQGVPNFFLLSYLPVTCELL